MTPRASSILSEISGSLFWQPKAGDEPAIGCLLAERLIQPIRQGKLSGYALIPAGYVRWISPYNPKT